MWDLKQSSITKVTNKKNKPTNKEKGINWPPLPVTQILNFKADIPELPYLICSALQDSSSVSAASNNEIIKKNVSSHKNPVLGLEWLPINVEFDRKNI